MNVLRRPIHPDPGNANMAMAARLDLLYSYGQTNGQPWTTDYSAATIIQADPMQIPFKTRAEKAEHQVDPHGGANPQRPKPGIGIEEGDTQLEGGTEGDDISLTSETGKAMANGATLDEHTSLKLKMIVSQRDPRVASEVEGAKNNYPADVGDTLAKFDADRHEHGTEFALRNLYAGPCGAFLIPLDSVVANVKARVFSPAGTEAKWETLPGIKS